MAIWGLGHLNERKQNAQKEEAVQNEGADEDEEQQAASGSTSGIDEISVSPDLPLQSPSEETPTDDHAMSQLLHPRDVSSVRRGYGTQPRLRESMEAATPAEVRRGKLFASLCATTVVFAWGLFLVTSFIKIRSKRERGGHL